MFSDTEVTPSRVGEALRAARRDAGLSRREAASRAGFRVKELRGFERGKALASETTIDRLADVYERDLSSLVPPRTTAPVVLDAFQLRVGDATARLKSQDPPRDEVLRGYLGLLYDLRDERPGTEIPLRTYDMDSLADALGDTPDAIETRLIELMHVTRDEAAAIRAALIRRRLIIPAAGIALGAGVFSGSMKLVDQHDARVASPQVHAAAAPIRTPVAISSATLARAATTVPTSDGVVTHPDVEDSPPSSSSTTSTSDHADAPSAPATVSAPAVATPPAPDDAVVTPGDDVVVPPSDDVVVPPADDVVVPPSDDVVVPPSDDVTTPPADDVVVPPGDDTETPPPDDVIVPPADDVVVPPVECPPEKLAQADAPQQLLSLQSLGSQQSLLSTGMRINTGQDDPAGLIPEQDGTCDPPPPVECPPDPDGSQQLLSLLRDADMASESSTEPNDAAAPEDDKQSLGVTQNRLATGLRINSAQDDPAGLHSETGDDCKASDGQESDELQQANQLPQTILQLLR